MKLLVIGGCGYTGTMLVPQLLADGHDVKVIDAQWFGNYLAPHPRLTMEKNDILNYADFSMRGFDAVVQLANVANDPCGELNSKLSWEVNVLATMGLVEKAIEGGVKQFIFASSGSVYGVKEEPEVTEDLSLVPISDYNKTKMIAERVLLSYGDRIAIQIVRPATVCGYSPRMRLDVSVNMLTMQALSRGKITVFGGNQVRPNIHILDLVDVYRFFLGAGSRHVGIYNAGFENISILEIAERVKARVPCEVSVTASNDPRSYRLSSRKLTALGFQPKRTVNDAIEEIRRAYQDGQLRDEERYYNLKMMKKVLG